MCMEDIRVMRKTVPRGFSATLSATPSLVVGYNKNRVALILGNDSANHIHYQFGNNLGAGLGIIVTTGAGPLVLDIQRHGNLVHGPWFADSSAGTPTVGYAETILEQQ